MHHFRINWETFQTDSVYGQMMLNSIKCILNYWSAEEKAFLNQRKENLFEYVKESAVVIHLSVFK